MSTVAGLAVSFGSSKLIPEKSTTKDTKLIDYKNSQIILIGAREGKDVIRNEIGIEIEEDDHTQQQSADIFSKLKLRKDQIPIRPIIEGRLE
jgi:hypothetical protein